ncbi:MAG: TlpA family protein disulfide reductase [Alphaproteobacteria bacterium]
MPKIIIILCLVLMGCLFALWDLNGRPEMVPVQDAALMAAPDVTLTDINGNTVALYDLKGKPVLLNIWATWCTPCIVEMPQLLELSQRHKNDMVFIALSTDRDVATITKFFDRLPNDVRSFVNADNVIFAHDPRLEISKGAFGTDMYPETYIINADMEIVQKIAGITDWLGDDVNALLFGTTEIADE